MPAGETTKTLHTYGEIVDGLLEAGVERRTAVIALGGGVVGDLAGFAAATMLRGLPFVQIPTTLLAQVDSSVGGKTGINTPRGKNLVGAFHQPRAVLADTDTLATLPPRELRAGYAEIAKYGLIGDAAFFAWCEQNAAALLAGDREVQADAILRACAFKAAVVGDDEREESPRTAAPCSISAIRSATRSKRSSATAPSCTARPSRSEPASPSASPPGSASARRPIRTASSATSPQPACLPNSPTSTAACPRPGSWPICAATRRPATARSP